MSSRETNFIRDLRDLTASEKVRWVCVGPKEFHLPLGGDLEVHLFRVNKIVFPFRLTFWKEKKIYLVVEGNQEVARLYREVRATHEKRVLQEFSDALDQSLT